MTAKSDALRPLDEAVSSAGFQKADARAYEYRYRIGVDGCAFGTLFLNVASKRSPVGTFEVNPVIGVVRADVRALIEEVADSVAVSKFGPILQTSIGYVMPTKRYEAWTFRTGQDVANSVEAGQLVATVATYGLPFFQAHCRLSDILSGLVDDRLGTRAEYDTPAVLMLLNRAQEAEAYMAEQLTGIGERTDVAAERYRQFADRLRASWPGRSQASRCRTDPTAAR